MHVTGGSRDGALVVFLHVPSGGPPVTLDPAGWARLQAAGVTSVIAQKGASGEAIVARVGKQQTAAARLVWGDDPPSRIAFANWDRRDLRRANLAEWRPPPPIGSVVPPQRRSASREAPQDAAGSSPMN